MPNIGKELLRKYGARIDEADPVGKLISIMRGEPQMVRGKEAWPPMVMQADVAKFLAARRVPILKALEVNLNPNASPEDWVRAIQKAKAEALAGNDHMTSGRIHQKSIPVVLDAPALDTELAQQKNGHA